MSTLAECYLFLATHQIVIEHSESEYLRQLFADLAGGNFESRQNRPASPSVLSLF
jgi:hypothetical protein